MATPTALSSKPVKLKGCLDGVSRRWLLMAGGRYVKDTVLQVGILGDANCCRAPYLYEDLERRWSSCSSSAIAELGDWPFACYTRRMSATSPIETRLGPRTRVINNHILIHPLRFNQKPVSQEVSNGKDSYVWSELVLMPALLATQLCQVCFRLGPGQQTV